MSFPFHWSDMFVPSSVSFPPNNFDQFSQTGGKHWKMPETPFQTIELRGYFTHSLSNDPVQVQLQVRDNEEEEPNSSRISSRIYANSCTVYEKTETRRSHEESVHYEISTGRTPVNTTPSLGARRARGSREFQCQMLRCHHWKCATLPWNTMKGST